ncbi:MAG: BatA domain-containing protein [Verrucomicrobia bacterium]|nr:BatA domain-containing protein [Verrucomicrobiota bacterium]
MSLLAPLFLLGGLAVALPVVFHLIRRTTKERVPFSSLMFLMPSPPRVTRRSRLEHILLLLLRCLVLGLLALGFARPFFQKPMAAAPEAEKSKRLVLLLDISASMKRENLWAQARDKAEAVLAKVTPGDEVAVFAFDRQSRPVVGFEQWAAAGPGERAALAVQQVAALTPSWSATHLGSALLAAVETLEQTEKQDSTARRQIVVISDFQEGCRLDGLQGFEWPRGVEVVLEPVKARRPTNAGLQLVVENEETASRPEEAGLRIRVSNSSTAQREQFQVAWAGAAPSEAGRTNSIEAYIPPGQSRIVLAPKPPADTTSGALQLRGDDEDFDNTLHVVTPKPELISVLYLGNHGVTNHTQPLYYLLRAFQESRRQKITIAPRDVDSPLTAAELAGVRLMIVASSLPEQPLGVVEQFLRDGQTVLFVLSSAAAAATLGQLAGVPSLAAEEADVRNYAMFGQIDFQHPLFAPFADPRFSDFTKIHFWKHRRLDLGQLPGARALARFDDGEAALVEVPVGKGTVFALTSGWQPEDSQLALSSKFVPLLYSVLEQSGAIRARLSQYLIGDEVNLPGPGSPQPITLRKPDGTTVTLAASETKFSQTDQPGLYEVTSAQPPVRFAVNLAPEESKTAPLSADEVERLGVPLKYTPIQTASQVEQTRRQLHATELESRQKLWRWLLVVAFVVLMAETWLAGWLTRRTVAQPEAPV